jgi:hypothetical protein
MLRKLEYICLVASIGLISSDRIDLAAGHLPFVLNPFLVLAPLVALLHLLRTGPARMFHILVTPPIRRQIPFLAAAGLFLIFAIASVPFGLDPERGLVAVSDFCIVATLGYYLSVRILTDPAPERLIIRSLTFGLIVYIFFCIGECIAWSYGLRIDITRSGPWLESTFAPGYLGEWVPTLSGAVFDSNRAGFDLTMFLALLDRFTSKSRYTSLLRVIIGVLLVLTLSRSAALCWLAYYIFSGNFWRKLVLRRVLLRLGIVVVIASILFGVYQREIVGLLEVWEISDAISAKLSMGQGSSGESHVLLIERGIDTWLTSPKTVISGIGFAGAPNVLQDFFGTDKHGNFHSLYVTTLAEMGLPAFLVLMFLLGYPLIARKGTICAIAAIMVFNVSYQVHMEAMFWLMLALLWSYEQKPLFLGLALDTASN